MRYVAEFEKLAQFEKLKAAGGFKNASAVELRRVEKTTGVDKGCARCYRGQATRLHRGIHENDECRSRHRNGGHCIAR